MRAFPTMSLHIDKIFAFSLWKTSRQFTIIDSALNSRAPPSRCAFRQPRRSPGFFLPAVLVRGERFLPTRERIPSQGRELDRERLDLILEHPKHRMRLFAIPRHVELFQFLRLF